MTPQESGTSRRSLLRVAVDDIARLAHITNVLARHGYATLAHRGGLIGDAPSTGSEELPADPAEAARRFRCMLEELGPTFVKIGQLLSTRPDVIPAPFIVELSRLQDSATPVAFDQIRAAVEEGLGAPLEELFATFDETPVAAASMAQTHRATLLDGAPVIVKVQRPGIAETMRSDLDLLHIFARLLEMTVAEMDFYAPADIVRVLDDALSHELDFLHEAVNLQTFIEHMGDDPDFAIPRVFSSHTARTVLTMEFIAGEKVGDLVPGSERAEKTALRLMEAFYRMIFQFGSFHADPHPGNLIVADDGRLAFIDFGLCGFLSATQRDRLVTLIIAVLTGDVDGIARVLMRMGRPLGHISLAEFRAEVSSIRDRHLKRSLRQVDMSAFLAECLDAAQRFRIRIATDYSLLSKAGVTLEGVIRTLAPDLDLFEHVGPYQRRLLESQYSSERLLKAVVGGSLHLGGFIRDMPDQLEQVLMDVGSGRLRVRVDDAGTRALIGEMNRQTTRLMMGLCAAALTIVTPLVYPHEAWWLFDRIPALTTLCALGALTFGFWGLAWHVVGGTMRDWRIRAAPLLRLLRRR